MSNREPITYSATLGLRTEQNPCVAELVAIALALQGVPPYLLKRQIIIFTSGEAAVQAVGQPRQQSG